MNPSIWGGSAWFFIHNIAYMYKATPEQKYGAKLFFESLKYVLPCSICCKNYTNHMKHHPLTDEILSGGDKLFDWTLEIHALSNKNAHNKHTDKKVLLRQYITTLKKYRQKVYKK